MQGQRITPFNTIVIDFDREVKIASGTLSVTLGGNSVTATIFQGDDYTRQLVIGLTTLDEGEYEVDFDLMSDEQVYLNYQWRFTVDYNAPTDISIALESGEAGGFRGSSWNR